MKKREQHEVGIYWKQHGRAASESFLLNYYI